MTHGGEAKGQAIRVNELLQVQGLWPERLRTDNRATAKKLCLKYKLTMSHLSAWLPHSQLDLQTLRAMTEGFACTWEKAPWRCDWPQAQEAAFQALTLFMRWWHSRKDTMWGGTEVPSGHARELSWHSPILTPSELFVKMTCAMACVFSTTSNTLPVSLFTKGWPTKHQLKEQDLLHPRWSS